MRILKLGQAEWDKSWYKIYFVVDNVYNFNICQDFGEIVFIYVKKPLCCFNFIKGVNRRANFNTVFEELYIYFLLEIVKQKPFNRPFGYFKRFPFTFGVPPTNLDNCWITAWSSICSVIQSFPNFSYLQSKPNPAVFPVIFSSIFR